MNKTKEYFQYTKRKELNKIKSVTQLFTVPRTVTNGIYTACVKAAT
jgi:hypothetical protein